MKILDKNISKKAEEDINNLTSSFTKKTEYFDILKTTLKGFGAVYHDNPNMYEVYITSLLDGNDFEANVICELLHIKEAEKGFPECGIKNSETIIKEQNTAFFQYLKHSFDSAVLDINVFSQLKEMGYDYSFFTNYKLDLIKDINKETNMEDKYNQASFAVQFLLFALTATKEQLKEATEIVDSIFNGVATNLLPMAEKISKIGFDTAEKAFAVMCLIVDEYKLWDVFYVKLGDDKVRTHGTYLKYFGIE